MNANTPWWKGVPLCTHILVTIGLLACSSGQRFGAADRSAAPDDGDVSQVAAADDQTLVAQVEEDEDATMGDSGVDADVEADVAASIKSPETSSSVHCTPGAPETDEGGAALHLWVCTVDGKSPGSDGNAVTWHLASEDPAVEGRVQYAEVEPEDGASGTGTFTFHLEDGGDAATLAQLIVVATEGTADGATGEDDVPSINAAYASTLEADPEAEGLSLAEDCPNKENARPHLYPVCPNSKQFIDELVDTSYRDRRQAQAQALPKAGCRQLHNETVKVLTRMARNRNCGGSNVDSATAANILDGGGDAKKKKKLGPKQKLAAKKKKNSVAAAAHIRGSARTLCGSTDSATTNALNANYVKLRKGKKGGPGKTHKEALQQMDKAMRKNPECKRRRS